MPTITTTVTSAQASGVTTTCTTTLATPEPAAADAAFALPKISNGQAWLFIKFQFANKADMDTFNTANFSGTQGSAEAGGCTMNVWEGTTANLVYGIMTMDTANGGWKTQNTFWGSHPTIAPSLGKATWWETSVFGDYEGEFKNSMSAWGEMPNCRGQYWCNDSISAFNLNKVKRHSVIMCGVHDANVPSFGKSVADFVSFSKCFTSSFAMGDVGGGQTMVLQVYDEGADLGRHGDAFTPWMQSGANPACIEWLTTTAITNYAVGGLSPEALKALVPYGDLANFDQVYPALIGGAGGDGTGGSHVVHYFKDAADANAGKKAYNKVFQAARDGGANIGGTCTDYRGSQTAISIIVNWNKVPDWAAAHTIAYADDEFQAVVNSQLHCSVEIYGSMTYELASTFPGWESLGSVVFRDPMAVYTSVHGVEQSDDPVECMQFIDVDGDWQNYHNFFLDPKVAKLTHEHKVTFVLTKYGPNKGKMYFRFANSQSFADYWTAAAGDTLTGLVANGKKIDTFFWGNYNPAARAVIALYETMPQFIMNEIRADKV